MNTAMPACMCVCACVFVFGWDKGRKKPYTIVLNMCEKCLPTLRYTHVCIISFLPFWYCYTQISCGSLACSQQIGLNTIKHIVPIVDWMPSSELGTLGTDAKKPNGSCPFFLLRGWKIIRLHHQDIFNAMTELRVKPSEFHPTHRNVCVYVCVCVGTSENVDMLSLIRSHRMARPNSRVDMAKIALG